MDLVRFTPRSPHRDTKCFPANPLFYEKLIGPARQAILLARQLLIGEQRLDGSWGSVSRSAQCGMHSRTRLIDTLLVMQSLGASGTSMNSRALLDGTKWLLRSRHCSSHLDVIELAAAIRLLAAARATSTHCVQVLPPELGVVYRSTLGKRQNVGGRFAEYFRPLANTLIKQLIARQEGSGRWQSVALTGIALEAISSANADFARFETEHATEFLDSRQYIDGSWGGSSPHSVITTASALCGLCAAGIAADETIVTDGVSCLADNQRANGSWGDNEMGCAAETAWALLAFVASGKSDDSAALSAVNYLVKTQDKWGSWVQNTVTYPSVVGDGCPDSDLQAIAWPLLALSRWAVAAASAQSATANNFTLRLFATPDEN